MHACTSHTDLRALTTRRAVLTGSAAALSATALTVVGGTDAAEASTTDPYHPSYGDSRYSVSHYGIGDTVIVNGNDTHLYGATTMQARAGVALTSLEVDFGLRVTRVLVNGRDVSWQKISWRKVRITGFSLAAGASFTLTIRYDDYPVARCRAVGLGDGVGVAASLVSFFGEPNGATFWYPSNDRLTNKATYSISVSTQRGYNAVGPGILASRMNFTAGGRAMSNVTFSINQPVHSWAPALHVGRMSQKFGTWSGPNGEQVWSTFTSDVKPPAAVQTHTYQALTYLSRLYGRFPFDRAGAFTPSFTFPIYALENIGAPVYSPDILGGNTPNIVAHETAHMWFGNSVTAASWRDVSLIHEGIAMLLATDYCAVYAPWIKFTSSASRLVSNPGIAGMFGSSTYLSALGVMRELRHAIDGSYAQTKAPRFTSMLRGLATDFRYRSITRDQFKARATAAAGRDLTRFWNDYGL
jgi:aminopeptidase N